MLFSSGVKHALKEAANWLVVSAIAIGTVVWFDEIKAGVAEAMAKAAEQRMPAQEPETDGPPGTITLKSDSRGHFFARAEINGRPLDVLVDTGASLVALSYEDAERVGLYVRPSEFTGRVNTANGMARYAPVVIDSLSVGDITLSNVQAAVSEPGRLGTTLLGMTFIGRLSRAEMRNGVLVLEE